MQELRQGPILFSGEEAGEVGRVEPVRPGPEPTPPAQLSAGRIDRRAEFYSHILSRASRPIVSICSVIMHLTGF